MMKSRRGSALLVVLVLLIVFVGLAAAFMTISSTSHFAALRDAEAETAFTIAESGIHDSLNELNANIDYGGDGMGAAEGMLGRGEYSVEIEPPFEGPRRYTLRATAEIGDTARQIVAVVAPEGMPVDRFATALFGDIFVNLHVQAAVDSWQSKDGDYVLKRTNRFRNQMYASAKAHVKSNHDVRLGPGAKVFGDVTAGPEGIAEMQGSAHVSGTSGTAESLEKLAPVEVPDVPSSGLRIVRAGTTFTLDGGSHHYDRLVIEASATIKIRGPATLVVDSMTVAPQGRIVIDGKNGTVTIYATGTFQLDPTSEWQSTTKIPADLTLRIATDTTKPDQAVEIDGKGKFYGTVYAPRAALKLDTAMDLFGAVAAKSIEVGARFEIHYDEALAPSPSPPQYRLVTWSEEPVEKKKKGK